MEMVAIEEMKIGQDITPPLPPLAVSLYTSTLSSHCSACFSPLPPSPPQNAQNTPPPTPLYCSHHCSSLDTPLHLSSESDLFPLLPDSSDLRLTLRLLHLLPKPPPPHLHRLFGLLTNHHKLFNNVVQNGVKTIVNVLGKRNELVEAETVEAVLCLVITNAVEVVDESGRGIGVAVYDWRFSWVNHSCSPNGWFRFDVGRKDEGGSRLRIYPNAIAGERRDKIGLMDQCGTGSCGYGPRVILRSIKGIKKGEEVTITYTDLLQPKASRQSELWMKYRFDCCCKRCIAVPATYLDQILEETFDGNLCQNSSNNNHNEKCSSLADWQACYDDAITEYLSLNDPKSCCQKLENLLSHGFTAVHAERMESNPQNTIMIHPLNHLALNSYTILSSAYKVRAYLLPESEKCPTEAFNLLRVSAAYSLMLAGAAHHFLQTEPSLIASVANFWTSAGDSLLDLARSQICDEGPRTPTGYNCSKCSCLDLFETISNGQEADKQFEEITATCLDCIIDMRSRLWGFLIPLDCYLKEIEGSSHYNVFETMDWFKMCNGKESVPRDEASEPRIERIDLFQLGIHCLLYGAFLSSICYCTHSHILYHVKNITCKEYYDQLNDLAYLEHRHQIFNKKKFIN